MHIVHAAGPKGPEGITNKGTARDWRAVLLWGKDAKHLKTNIIGLH